MKAKVVWEERLKFIGTADSGFEVKLDSKKEVGGDDSGLRPTELLAIATASCTAMDVISILQKKRQEVTAFEVRVDAERAIDHPRKVTGMTIEYVVTGNNIEYSAVQRAVELSEEKYCSVINTLKGNVAFGHKITINEAESN